MHFNNPRSKIGRWVLTDKDLGMRFWPATTYVGCTLGYASEVPIMRGYEYVGRTDWDVKCTHRSRP